MALLTGLNSYREGNSRIEENELRPGLARRHRERRRRRHRLSARFAAGRSTVSQEDADKSARLEVIKSLEVRVDGVARTSRR